MGVRKWRQNGHFPPGNWDKETKIYGKPEVSSLIPIDSLNSYNDGLFAGKTLTAQESDSLFWFHALISLQFTHVRSVACRGRMRNL